MNIERADEHIRVLRSFLKADLEESLADSERRLTEASAKGQEFARMHYQEHVDWLRAFRARFESRERDAA